MALLQQAMQDDGAGRADHAHHTCQQVFQIEADNADDLHLLGMLERQFGASDSAPELIARVIEVTSQEAMLHR